MPRWRFEDRCRIGSPSRRRCRVRPTIFASTLAACAVTMAAVLAAQNPDGTRASSTPSGPVEPPHKRAAEVGWRLAPSEQSYAALDGVRLKEYVSELTAISRRYRD